MSTVLDASPFVLDSKRVTEANVVIGVHCKNEHFNDPRVAYCAVCGISMTQATRRPVLGCRPPLGVLVLDDGAMRALDRDHVIGRDPAEDRAVAEGRSAGITVDDPMVSRVHARVTLDEWDVCVVDAGSTNGTYVWSPGQPNWRRLAPGEAARLRPGSAVSFGTHQFNYHSYRHL